MQENCPNCQNEVKLISAGENGSQKFATALYNANIPTPQVESLYWDDASQINYDLPDHYDLKDHILSGSSSGKSGYQTATAAGEILCSVLEQCRPYPTDDPESPAYTPSSSRKTNGSTKNSPIITETESETEPVECRTYEELFRRFSTYYETTPIAGQVLSTVLATILSTDLPDAQVFLRILGPPGTGKTTCVNPFLDSPYVEHLAEFRGFHSGFVGSAQQQRAQGNASPLEYLNHKTAIITDADTILQSPNRDKILAEARQIFDGRTKADYRNRQVHEYLDLRITLIFCGTATLTQLNRSSLGERFIDIRYNLNDVQRRKIVRRAAQNQFDAISEYLSYNSNSVQQQNNLPLSDPNRVFTLDEINGSAIYLVEQLKDSLNNRSVELVPFTPQQQEYIDSLAYFTAGLRPNTPRTQDDEADEQDNHEVPSRLGKQFTKLAICLAMIHAYGKTRQVKLTPEVLTILRMIALDTINQRRKKLLQPFLQRIEQSIEEREVICSVCGGTGYAPQSKELPGPSSIPDEPRRSKLKRIRKTSISAIPDENKNPSPCLYCRGTGRKAESVGLTISQLEAKTEISQTQIKRMLPSSIEAGLLSRNPQPNHSGKGGRHTHYIYPTPLLETVWKGIGLPE